MILFGVDVPKLIGDLKEIDSKSAEYAGLPAKVARLKKEHAATTKLLDRATAELEEAETNLAQHQAVQFESSTTPRYKRPVSDWNRHGATKRPPITNSGLSIHRFEIIESFSMA
jgi:hypothetical protein